MKNKKVLIFAAHPDDEVLGCGGTISHHRKKGDKVGVCYLSEGVSSRFEYIKKTEKSFGKVLVGLQTKNVGEIELKLKMNKFNYKKINEEDLIYSYLV